MKRYYLLSLLIPAYFLLSYASGAPWGYSGSASDNGRTCAQCHSNNGTTYSPTFDVQGLPTSGYDLGQTYSIHLTVNNVSNNKTGFEATAENASNQKAGTFASSDNNTQAIQSNTYITHTTAGNTRHDWTFNWTAPATSQGAIKLYYMVNMTNGDGNTTGDYVQGGFVEIPENTGSIQNVDADNVKIFPNPVLDYLQIESPNSFSNASIIDMQGRTYYFNVENSQINVSSLSPGNYILKLQNEQFTTTKQFVKK